MGLADKIGIKKLGGIALDFVKDANKLKKVEQIGVAGGMTISIGNMAYNYIGGEEVNIPPDIAVEIT